VQLRDREFYLTPMLLSIALSFAAVFVLARRAGGGLVSAALGVFELVLSKAFVDYSTLGPGKRPAHLSYPGAVFYLFPEGKLDESIF